ncbi:DUF5677 domain-containing protein [Propioniciclava flava]|uniref:Uncharacterized protein n=1 Tax=Propioniciclava flava TaxID=2072026 RepID=A0A4Q2EGN4_9ACTN|nr:DUF5677 domain-containing protein [Propioniciclava flava]RXW31524.1 hypothetical protein C1706_11665 [Propioniciclava flava]
MDEYAQLAKAFDELLAGWDEFVETSHISWRASGARKGRDRSPAQTAIVVGLVTHVHETARLLRPAMPAGLTIVHMPLVRSIYESTLTAVWADEVADGAEAIMKEDGRQRRALQRAWEGIESFKDGGTIPYTEWADVETPSATQARNFEQLAGEVALDGAYAYFRVLSNLSHVSIMTVDEYVEEIDSNHSEASFRFIARPEPMGGTAWSSLVAYCLVWSGMVANYYDETRSRRNELRHIARELGINAELPVNARAIAKRRRADAQKTLAKR